MVITVYSYFFDVSTVKAAQKESTPMRIRYDPEVDALSVLFRDATVTTRDLEDGIVGEFDAENHLVGLEILDAAARFGDPSTLQEVILEGVGLTAPLATKGTGRG